MQSLYSYLSRNLKLLLTSAPLISSIFIKRIKTKIFQNLVKEHCKIQRIKVVKLYKY